MFYGKSQKDYVGVMDLSSMQLGKKQYINVEKQQSNSNKYYR
jgi:hypothetical protein